MSKQETTSSEDMQRSGHQSGCLHDMVWSEKIGELMRQKETLVFEEMLSVPVINLCQQTIVKGDSDLTKRMAD